MKTPSYLEAMNEDKPKDWKSFFFGPLLVVSVALFWMLVIVCDAGGKHLLTIREQDMEIVALHSQLHSATNYIHQNYIHDLKP